MAWPHERALDVAREALLVETVTGLVQHGEEPREEIGLALARRQAHVAGREAGGERVRGLVQPAGLEVEADRGGEARAQGALLLRGVGAVHERVVRPRARGDLARERHELVAQAVQQRLQPGHAHVGLVLVEQRVVALAALVADGVGLLAPQRDETLERIAEEREVGLGAGDLPGLEARGLGLRQLAHEPGRDAHRAVALAARLAHARALELAEARVVGELGDRLAEALVADALVEDPRERRLGGAARRGAARGHVDLLVPAEQPADVTELAHVALELLEDVPGLSLLSHGHQGVSELMAGYARSSCRSASRRRRSRSPTRSGSASRARARTRD